MFVVPAVWVEQAEMKMKVIVSVVKKPGKYFGFFQYADFVADLANLFVLYWHYLVIDTEPIQHTGLTGIE